MDYSCFYSPPPVFCDRLATGSARIGTLPAWGQMNADHYGVDVGDTVGKFIIFYLFIFYVLSLDTWSNHMAY